MIKPVRPIRVVGNIAFVPLTRGYTATICAEDAAIVAGYHWRAKVDKKTVYAVTSVLVDGCRKVLSMHRLILGNPKGAQVDHRDTDGLNNVRSNLRLATHAENQQNKTPYKNNTTGAKGIYWDARVERWRARIAYNSKRKSLGYFATKDEAQKAYADAASQLHGDFANI